MIPRGIPYTSHNSYPCTIAVVSPTHEPASSYIKRSVRSPRILEGLSASIPTIAESHPASTNYPSFLYWYPDLTDNSVSLTRGLNIPSACSFKKVNACFTLLNVPFRYTSLKHVIIVLLYLIIVYILAAKEALISLKPQFCYL